VRFATQGKWFVVKAILKAHGEIWRKLGYWRKKHRNIVESSEQNIYLHDESVVWTYFMQGKHKFSDLKHHDV
jgi:hypothetical protein